MIFTGKIKSVVVSTDKEGKPRKFQGKDGSEYECFSVNIDVKHKDADYVEEFVAEYSRKVDPQNEPVPFLAVVQSCEDVQVKISFRRREYGGKSYMSVQLYSVTQAVQ